MIRLGMLLTILVTVPVALAIIAVGADRAYKEEEEMILIEHWKHKPVDCTECPLLTFYDECALLDDGYENWEEQYRDCPLKEIKEMPKK